MEETTDAQKILMLLGIFMGLGLIMLFVYLIKRDTRTLSEKLVDRAKDLGSNIPRVNK